MQIAAAIELKQKLISQTVRDPLFADALEQAADEIADLSRNAANEATVESAFERVLYAVLRDVGIPFHPVKEKPIKTRRHTARGRTDSRLGGVIIEFKQPTTLRRQSDIDAATVQLTEYVEAIAEETENEVVGYLTDGTKCLEVRVSNSGLISTSAFASISGNSLARLVGSLVSLSHSALTAENLIRDFCSKAGTGTMFDLARGLNRVLRDRATQKTKMLQAEWEAMFRLAHDDRSQQTRIQDRREALTRLFNLNIDSSEKEYRALFALDTAYAIVLKAIAYRVVSDVRFKHVMMEYKSLTEASDSIVRTFVAALEDGDLFRQVGIVNLLEGDFFSWYSDEAQWDDFMAKSIRQVLITLSYYEDSRTVFASTNAVDLFRALYEATVPQAVRSSLGEFYTPFWLAEHVIASSRPIGKWKLLDPCCGSGTFLIAAIARLRATSKGLKPSDLANEILSRVYGIDLNPLAVLTARVQYFIHIADLLNDHSEPIVIPVFLGDASNIPETVREGGVTFIKYQLKTLQAPIEVRIPTAMAQDIASFFTTMNDFEALVKQGDYTEATELLLERSDAYRQPSVVRDAISTLAESVIDLEKREWNGIWARIIANFVATASVGRFTNVVGNPPWVDWKSLPSGYREKIKGLCLEKGLFSGAGRTGGVNLNICALIAHVAATNWLGRSGRMSLLMPRELANQASYEGWRRAVGGLDCHLTSFDDWSKAGHPFEPVREDFMTFHFVKGRAPAPTLPVRDYKKATRGERAHLWSDLVEANRHLIETPRVAAQIMHQRTAFTIADSETELRQLSRVSGVCAYVGREGVELYPQELLLFRYLGKGPLPGTAMMANIQVKKSKYRIPAQRIILETKYLFPLAKGPGIDVMGYDDPEIYAIFPYESTDPYAPVPRKELKKSSPHLLAHLTKYRDIIAKQSHFTGAVDERSEFYGIARTGPYSFREKYVAFRDNSRWCAAVIGTKKTPWGERKRFLFQNHAVSMCERAVGGFMSSDETYFVAGIFNTDLVRRFIYASSDNRSFKIRPPVFVPLFDKKNPTHVAIVARAKALERTPDAADVHLAAIQRHYLSMCPRARGLTRQST